MLSNRIGLSAVHKALRNARWDHSFLRSRIVIIEPHADEAKELVLSMVRSILAIHWRRFLFTVDALAVTVPAFEIKRTAYDFKEKLHRQLAMLQILFRGDSDLSGAALDSSILSLQILALEAAQIRVRMNAHMRKLLWRKVDRLMD